MSCSVHVHREVEYPFSHWPNDMYLASYRVYPKRCDHRIAMCEACCVTFLFEALIFL